MAEEFRSNRVPGELTFELQEKPFQVNKTTFLETTSY